jgi:amidase
VLLAPFGQVLPFPVRLEYPTSASGVEFCDHPGWMRYRTLISLIGCPALSMPDGFPAHGLPVDSRSSPHCGPTGGCRGSGTPFERAAGSGRRRPARG